MIQAKRESDRLEHGSTSATFQWKVIWGTKKVLLWHHYEFCSTNVLIVFSHVTVLCSTGLSILHLKRRKTKICEYNGSFGHLWSIYISCCSISITKNSGTL